MDFPAELSWAHPVTAEWFVTKFATPTEPQTFGWPEEKLAEIVTRDSMIGVSRL